MFCPKCGAMLRPLEKEGVRVIGCSCGYVKEDGKLDLKISEKTKERVDLQVMKDEPDDLPVMEYDCKSCGNKEAYYWILQTRSADEPPTRFFKCTKCKQVHREYK